MMQLTPDQMQAIEQSATEVFERKLHETSCAWFPERAPQVLKDAVAILLGHARQLGLTWERSLATYCLLSLALNRDLLWFLRAGGYHEAGPMTDFTFSEMLDDPQVITLIETALEDSS